MRAGYTSHCLLLFCCLLQSATAFAGEKDVRAWLQSMVESVRTLNYRGTFVFLHDNQLESMEIFHTVDARGEKERPVSVEVATGDGYTRPPLHDFFMTRYTDAYAAEIAAFVSVIKDGKAPSPNGRDGLMALVLADAALKSVQEGRAVKVSEVMG